MNRKYMYSSPIISKLPGSNQDYYLRTVTSYEVDGNGKAVEGSAETYVYYTGIGNARWQQGTEDSYGFNQNAWSLAAKTKDKGATYEYYNYSQEDKDAGKIPLGQEVGNPILGATAQQSLSSPGGIFYTGVQNAIINTAAKTQPGLAQVVSAKQQNTVRQQETAAAEQRRRDNEEIQANLSEATENLGRINDVEAKEFGELRYPIGSDTNGQDYIQFTVFEYLPQERSESNLTYNEKNTFSGKEKGLGRIFLPIQPTIMDTNSVSWGEDKFGILEMIGANLSLGAMTGDSADELSTKFAETVTTSGNKIDPKIVSAVQIYLAKMAVSSNNNLLSRLTGAVTNPNLTLLFNSPELRNFNFNFKLTPRTQSEGTEVRKIIRVFKQYMAVQRSAGNLFLEAPCIFKIRYIRGVDRFNKEKDLDHPALNRIKTCALKNFSVNYTPAGSYATYNDKAGTMSSYDLTMSFTELDPVYSDDYNGIPVDQIGY
jgi:hypothetical protein